jgi:outer membrane protein assembly factor BamB
MKRLLTLAALVLACGCSSSKEPMPGEHEPEGYAPTNPQMVAEEIGGLPFKHLNWDYKLNNRKITRMTLGSEHIYVETSNNHIIAINRFTGIPSWEYIIPTENAPDWPLVEAVGAGLEILEYERQLRLAEAAVDNEVKQTPIDDARIKKINDLKKKRTEWREKIEGAAVNDNVYFMCRGWLYCLDRRTGKEQWFTKVSFVPSNQPFATRVYVFVPSVEHSRLHVLRVDQRGREVTDFRLPLDRHNQIFERPFFFHPLLYVVSRDGTLRAYWVDREREHFIFKIQYPFMADPIVHRYFVKEKIRDEKDRTKTKEVDRIYDILAIGGMDKAFYGLDAGGGNILWKYHLPSVVKTPAVGKDGTIYVKTEDGYLHALEAMPQHTDKDGAVEGVYSMGRLRWQMPNAERFLLKTGSGVYILGENATVYKVVEATGKILGKYKLSDIKFVFTNTMDDQWYCGTSDGHLFSLQEWREQDLFQPTDRAKIQEEIRKKMQQREGKSGNE